MLDILEIIRNTESIYTTNSNLRVLKDFERVLSEMDMYVYDNWENGELVSGPHVDRHWVTASFMWPQKEMPDPTAGKRLLDYGCKVKYEKTFLVEPRKVEDATDLRPNTQKGKMDRHPIWIVEIQMPKKLCADIYNGYMNKMKEGMGMGNKDSAEAPPEITDSVMDPNTMGAEDGMGMDAGMADGGMPNV